MKKSISQEQDDRDARVAKLIEENSAQDLASALRGRKRADEFEDLEETLDKFHDICRSRQGEVKAVLTRLRAKIDEFTKRHYSELIEQEKRPF